MGLILVTAGTNPAVADEHEPPVNLSLQPVGQPGAFFDVTMEPGESREFEVTLSNGGAEAMDVRTYPADVYTLINGGLGAEEREGEPSGTTTWLEYPAEVFSLPAGEQITRSFTVTVPQDAAPGQYITSLVLENDVPVEAEGEGQISLNQIVRKVVAVSIRVPGPLEPAFEFGEADHRYAAGGSVVGVHLKNTGNARVAPVGELTVRDDSGDVVHEDEISMDTVFARTDTRVETGLDEPLEPGDYTLSISMTDPDSEVTATAEDLPFTVEPPEDREADSGDAGPGVDIFDNSGNGLILALVGTVIVLLLAVLFLLIRNHRRQKS